MATYGASTPLRIERVSWSRAASEIARKRFRGTAARLPAMEAYRILGQWRQCSRCTHLAIAACALLVLALATIVVALFALAASIGGPPGQALGGMTLVLAYAAVRFPVWRLPLAAALVRYRLVPA